MAAPKIAPTTFRFQPHVKDALLLISDQQGRSMANMLEWLIRQYCEHEGMDWPPKSAAARKGKGVAKARSPTARSAEREHE